MRWDKAEIPHKGWQYIGVEDLGEHAEAGGLIDYEQCEMCGNERIRYVHLLEHPDYNGEIRVGCVCASKMIDDYIDPKESERELRNRANRKINFMKREWRFKPDTGNYTLRYKGNYITIMKSKFNSNWGVIFKGEYLWDYNGKKITDLHSAKNVAFNLFDELYESREQIQPHWDGERWIYY